MKTHTKLQDIVLSELAWEPSIDASHIGVATQDGIVTLTGYVTSYAQKVRSEEVVKRLAGVKAIANDLAVELPGTGRKTDTELAQSCLSALAWDVEVPHDDIKVRVADGRVTLEGSVSWYFQRAAAERAVRRLTGVVHVTNLIAVTPKAEAREVKNRVEAALRRYAETEARGVQVEARGAKVTIRGTVHSWREREQVEQAAWSAPGVSQVADELVVRN
jgi:osmotically-inducible protein OsmY